MRADILADIVAAQAQAPQTSAELGFHQGVVLTWDEFTGANTVAVQGSTFTNLKVLTSGAGIVFTPGDTIALLRFQTTYFILGRVAAPGAGAALGTRQAYVAGGAETTSATYTDLPGSFGPEVSNVYISSAKRCLVFLSARLSCGNADAVANIEVTGASTIAAASTPPLLLAGTFTPLQATAANPPAHRATTTNVRVLTAADGLGQGNHTFTVKYSRTTYPGWTPAVAQYEHRRLVIMPF